MEKIFFWVDQHQSVSGLSGLRPTLSRLCTRVSKCAHLRMTRKRMEVRSWLSKRNSCMCFCETRSCGWTSRPWPLKISEGETTFDGLYGPAALRVDEWKTLKDKQRKEQSVCLCKCKARKNLSWHFLEVSLTFSPPWEHYLENCSKVSLVTNDKLLNCKYFSQSRCAAKRSWWIINIITDLKRHQTEAAGGKQPKG